MAWNKITNQLLQSQVIYNFLSTEGKKVEQSSTFFWYNNQ